MERATSDGLPTCILFIANEQIGGGAQAREGGGAQAARAQQ